MGSSSERRERVVEAMIGEGGDLLAMAASMSELVLDIDVLLTIDSGEVSVDGANNVDGVTVAFTSPTASRTRTC